MWTNIDDNAMESTILRDLADFDISAPIKVTVCFDTDCDVTSDILIKTENDTDSNIVVNNVVENFASVRDLKLKEEIKDEPSESHGATEQINNNKETGHILKKITTHQAEEIQNKLPNNDDSRKRKQQKLQIYKNKKSAKMTEQKKTDDITEKWDENGAQETVNASTIESSVLVYNKTLETTPLPQPHLRTVLPNPSMVPPQPDVHVQANVKANCQTMLADLADNMRHILEAYLFQKQFNTSKENFISLKDRYFNLSYDTVVKMILPMEQNKEFINLFLKETHRRAAEKSYYKCGYQDYAILLGELMTWVRKRPNLRKQKFNNTSQPTEMGENDKIQQELNQRQLRNNKQKIDNLNKSAEVNSVCIFSSGSPGSEISINIDPNINRYITSAIVNETNKDARNIPPPPVSIASQKQSQNPCNGVVTSRTNNKNNIMNASKQPPWSSSANMPVMDYQPPRSPEPNRNQSSLIELLTSIDIPTQQIQSRLPQEMQSMQSDHEIQQILYHSTNVPVQYGQSPSLPPKFGQTTNLQLQHGHSQSVQQQYRQPEVALPLHEQLLNNQLQVKSLYGTQQNMQQQHKHSVDNMPQYSQSQNRPQQVVQSPHSKHSVHNLPQYNLSQNRPQQVVQSPHSKHSVHNLPQYNQSQNRPQQVVQSPHSKHSVHNLPQYNQSQNRPQQVVQSPHSKHSVHNLPQYNQSQNRPQQVVQSPHSLHQYVQSQPVLPHHEQAQQQRSQTLLPNYNPYHNINGQPQAQSSHVFPHGGQVRPAPPTYSHYVLQQNKQPRNSPLQVGLPKPVHPCYEQPQHVLPQNQQSKNASSQDGQLQQQANHLKELLDKPQRLEWPHEFTAMYSQPNMQPQIQKNSPRSASTDSGFISPLNFNVSTEQTYGHGSKFANHFKENLLEHVIVIRDVKSFVIDRKINLIAVECQIDFGTKVPPPPETETSPLLITHVTSLNPKVSYIAEGECSICKKRTKKMCMGCMEYYYCSYDCQVKDWGNHQGYCKAGTKAWPDSQRDGGGAR